MATHIDASWPELVLPPGATISVELDNVAGIVTKLNVYGFTPSREETVEIETFVPQFTFGAAQR